MSKSKYWQEREQSLARSFFDCSAIKDLYLVSYYVDYVDKEIVFYTNKLEFPSCVRYRSIVVNLVPRSKIPVLIKEYSRVQLPHFKKDYNKEKLPF